VKHTKIPRLQEILQVCTYMDSSSIIHTNSTNTIISIKFQETLRQSILLYVTQNCVESIIVENDRHYFYSKAVTCFKESWNVRLFSCSSSMWWIHYNVLALQ